MKKLKTAKEVMEAFLLGKKLFLIGYGNDETGEMYLYLKEGGYIVEEDGAGAKADRIDFTWREEDPKRIKQLENRIFKLYE